MRYITQIILLISVFGFSQETPVETDSTAVKYMIIEGDFVAVTEIELDEVLVLPNLNFSSREERIKYIILRRKTHKVYPYAKLAAERLETLQKRLATLKRKREKKTLCQSDSKIY